MHRWKAAESAGPRRLHADTHPRLQAVRPGLTALGLRPGPRRRRPGAEGSAPQAAARLLRSRPLRHIPEPMAARKQTPELATLRPHHRSPYNSRHEFRRPRLLWAASPFPLELPLPPEVERGRSFLLARLVTLFALRLWRSLGSCRCWR